MKPQIYYLCEVWFTSKDLSVRFQGGVRGNDADASLTAFVLIALQEANHLCGKLVGVCQLICNR